ncbi:hypothetical protein PV11_04196 [Exophiala sideris]|uniref:Major facilitator superfamily (MFS) profile domain-containing protein n=1 Tax=Exophiala sideris TaxID=1016849 RepID=A0A0D1W045_9EURO|nr:hypothetical protein PV11_04196 [Exophiala sideris]
MSKTTPTHIEGQSSQQASGASDEPRHSEQVNFNDVDTFAERHGLTPHLNTFQKAAALLANDSDVSDGPGITAPEVQALQEETTRKWRQPRMFYFTVLVCSIGAIEQGWAQTGMNGANLYFPEAFGIGSNSKHDNFVVGLINSGIYLSTGLLGAWLSDPINKRLGRRGAVFVGSVLCLVANLGSALSRTWPQLLIFRFVLGAGLGINASTVSVYAAECAPAAIRGGIAVSWQMWVAFGIFLGFVTNVAAHKYGADAWRWQLAGPVIPTVPLLIMLHMCPESPAWYIKNERYDNAFQSLCRLRNTELQAAGDVYSTYLQRRAKTKVEDSEEPTFARKIMELFTIPRIRRATMASYVVMLSQQLCGINIIAFYSSTIFVQAGFSMLGALVASSVFGFVNFIGAFPAIWTMDSLGRRSLLLLTLPLMALTMLFTGLSFSIPPENAAHFGLVATLIYLFCALYSPGMGPVPNTYSAEVFPLSHREVGMSLAVATANFWAAILSLTFPRMVTALNSEGALVLYAILNVLALVLVFLFVPETKQKTLDELDGVFSVSTRMFIKYQTTKYLPWFAKRYILRQKEAELKPFAFGEEYQRLVGDDDVAEEEAS